MGAHERKGSILEVPKGMAVPENLPCSNEESLKGYEKGT